MTPEFVYKMIMMLGIPTTLSFVLGWGLIIVMKFNKKQFLDNEKERKELQEKYNNNLINTNIHLISVLEKNAESNLKVADAISKNADAISKNSDVLLLFSSKIDTIVIKNNH